VIVAIDGPAASGKSTVARMLAERLGFAYLDTGAMYRAVAVEALRRGIALDDSEALGALARSIGIAFEHEGGSALPTRVTADGRDVTAEIRTPEADAAVSPVSAEPRVREAMVAQQRREAALEPDTVLEGRDIGSVVLPGAELKVFLTAAGHERARRRALDMAARGTPMTEDDVLAKLESRDRYDSTRVSSPLVRAADALSLDTTCMSVQQVVDAISAWVEERR